MEDTENTTKEPALEIIEIAISKAKEYPNNINGFVVMPDCLRINRSNEPCDMIIGPCACGSWHSEKDWVEYFNNRNTLRTLRRKFMDNKPQTTDDRHGQEFRGNVVLMQRVIDCAKAYVESGSVNREIEYRCLNEALNKYYGTVRSSASASSFMQKVLDDPKYNMFR